MCNSFSCIIEREGRVHWKLGVDSHSELVEQAGLSDLTADQRLLTFAKVEITPKNKDYRRTKDNIPRTAKAPGEWVLTIDEKAKSTWWSPTHEMKCRRAHEEWCEQLYTILDTKTDIVNPFSVRCPKKITKKHLALLKQWSNVRGSVEVSVEDSVWNSVWDSIEASVWNSVGNSVWYSVEASVRNSVEVSVEDSVWGSVGNSVWVSIWDSVGVQIGSLFKLPRNAWKHTEKLPATPEYPFQSAVDLWKLGLVPSFDGKTWRLHGSPTGNGECEVVWEGRL